MNLREWRLSPTLLKQKENFEHSFEFVPKTEQGEKCLEFRLHLPLKLIATDGGPFEAASAPLRQAEGPAFSGQPSPNTTH